MRDIEAVSSLDPLNSPCKFDAARFLSRPPCVHYEKPSAHVGYRANARRAARDLVFFHFAPVILPRLSPPRKSAGHSPATYACNNRF